MFFNTRYLSFRPWLEFEGQTGAWEQFILSLIVRENFKGKCTKNDISFKFGFNYVFYLCQRELNWFNSELFVKNKLKCICNFDFLALLITVQKSHNILVVLFILVHVYKQIGPKIIRIALVRCYRYKKIFYYFSLACWEH
jgi:hypothetical protein